MLNQGPKNERQPRSGNPGGDGGTRPTDGRAEQADIRLKHPVLRQGHAAEAVEFEEDQEMTPYRQKCSLTRWLFLLSQDVARGEQQAASQVKRTRLPSVWRDRPPRQGGGQCRFPPVDLLARPCSVGFSASMCVKSRSVVRLHFLESRVDILFCVKF